MSRNARPRKPIDQRHIPLDCGDEVETVTSPIRAGIIVSQQCAADGPHRGKWRFAIDGDGDTWSEIDYGRHELRLVRQRVR